MSSLFTCVTCHVAFKDPEIQRNHYKTDWHRYNLKRKVVDLPPVDAQSFIERVQFQKNQIEQAKKEENEEIFCKLCTKRFTTLNSFKNHLQSNKHKELEAKLPKVEESINDELKDAIKSTRKQQQIKAQELSNTKKEEIEVEEEVMDDGDGNWEDIQDEEILKNYDESKGIDLLTCLFCEHKSQSVEAKMEHMATKHSFFIYDSEYLTDLEGLLKYLGIKIGVYNVCIWCSSKCYSSLKAVQSHMLDKGHTKMKFEGDTLYEYADFYTYNDVEDNYESGSDVSNEEEEAQNFVDNENYELVLPSGSRIGHRSLFRYYKQNFGHRNLQLKEQQQKSNLFKDKYKALGFGDSNKLSRNEIQSKRKDMAYFQRWRSKMQTRLGIKANKLQKNIRRQDITF